MIWLGDKQIRLFNSLPNEFVAEILDSLPQKIMNCDKIHYFQGDYGDAIYIVLRGNIALYQHTHDFRKSIFEVLHTGDCFGEAALFKNPHQEFAQVVKGSAKIAICNRNNWQKWVDKFPVIQKNMSEMLSQRIFYLQKRLANGTKLSEARLIDYLSYSMQKRGVQIGEEIWVPRILTHDDISCYINSTRQTVSTILADLRKQQKLDYNRHAFIIKKELLREMKAHRFDL